MATEDFHASRCANGVIYIIHLRVSPASIKRLRYVRVAVCWVWHAELSSLHRKIKGAFFSAFLVISTD